MSSFISAAPVASGQVQSLDSVRAHALPSDAMILASATLVNPTNQNTGSYAIVESSGGSSFVVNGSVPATTLSPFADLYKEGSVYFSGVNTANITYNSTSSFNFASGLTAEAWVNYQTFAGSTVTILAQTVPCLVGAFTPTNTVNTAWAFGVNTSGQVCLYYYAGAAYALASTQALTTNTWNHVAMSITSGGAINLYINGTSVASGTVQGGGTSSAGYLGAGSLGTAYTTGYVSDIRVVSGAALYTGSSFTVPSAPLGNPSSGVQQILIRAGQNSPTIQNGALTFDRGLKQYIEYGPQTFNLATQGFTAVFRWKNTGTAGSYERIFEFGNGYVNTTTCSSIVVWRDSQGLYFYIYPPGSAGGYSTYLNSGFLQNITYVVACRYDPSAQLMSIWLNGNPVGTPTTLTLANAADRTLATVRIGGDCTGANASYGPNASRCLTGTMNTFAIYNRALSNVEIYNSYLALNTVPQTPQQKTLEIGDINGTPALSVAGNGQVSVQSIGLSSNVVPWPPSGMVSFFTTINNGNYIASSSSYYSANPPWYAFDKTNTQWASAYNTPLDYSTSLPYNANSTAPSTTDVNGNVYLGAWLQIQLPVPITLSYYIFQGSFSVTTWGPARFVLLGSRDGVNWSLVDSQYGLSWSTSYQTKTCTPQNTRSYTYFRYVCLQVVGNPGNTEVGELTLYGTADTSPPLTIAPATTFVNSVATPSLVGISNPSSAFVPQDFSSSGLNIPAYVVSNTATTANTVAYSSFGPFAGEGSLYFPGGKGAYVAFPSGTSPNFSISGSTVATFECWFYPTGAPGATFTIFSHTLPYTSGTYDWTLYIETNNKLGWYGSSGVSVVYSTNTINFNAWNHAAWSFSSGTIYIALNGTVNTGTVGTPPNTSGWPLVIGTSAYSGANISNYWGYLSGVRIVQGLALYQSAFTPSTQPLTAIQGTTQAGLPYGTVLLLRNAPAPGRIQTTRLTGSNSVGLGGAPQVLSFPPAAMTGYSTALSSGYGQGTYVASASSEFSGSYLTWYAFDKSNNSWISSGPYNSSTGVYTGTTATVDVTGTAYLGEWLQIQLPSSMVLSSYTTTNDGSGYSPSAYRILGSRDGTNWYLVDTRSGLTSTSYTFAVSSGQAFTYFRLVGTSTVGAGIGNAVLVREWTLNGQIEGLNINPDGKVGLGVVNPTRALEVAGDVVCGGTLSAGNPLMFRNALYNGDMRVAQRGTSFVGTVGYTLDRWYGSPYGAGGAYYTISQIQSGLANFSNALQLQQTSTTVMNAFLTQSLETRDVVRFQGQPVTVSFWYKIPTSFSGTWSASLVWSAAVDTRLADPGASYTTAASITLTNTTAWTYASFTTFVPPTAQSLAVMFATTGSTVNGATIQITGVQIEKGLVASPFEVRPYATELALCQRYYQKSYQQGDYAGTATSTNGIIAVSAVNVDSIAGTRFNVPMRATPGTTTIYSTAGTAGKATVFNGGADTSAITTTYATNVGIGYLYINAANLTQGNGYRYHYVADAEL